MANVTPYGKITSVEQLGAMVRKRRKEIGSLQSDLAGFANVSTKFLSEMERGKQTAEIGKVFQVLEQIGLDVWVVPRGARLK
jgi:transcriptional regulator with XRE-family HTH domain